MELPDRAMMAAMQVAEVLPEVAAVPVLPEVLVSELPGVAEAQHWLPQFQAAASIIPEVAVVAARQLAEQADQASAEPGP